MAAEFGPQSPVSRGKPPAKVKSREDVTTAYVILTPGEPIDIALLRALETLQLVVKYCGRNDVDGLCCDGSSIVVADFSNFIEMRNPIALYYGPLAIKRSVASKRRLPFTGHSMLSTVLYGKACCLRVPRESQKIHRLRIYALGGRLADSIANASFLVTSTAAGKMYDIARKLGIKIVTPKLIDYLWHRRDHIDFELDEAHLQRFRLPVFANIKMSFLGFDESTRFQLEETATLNGAIVLVSPTASSIVIMDPSMAVPDADVMSKRSLGIEWFHQSLADGHAKSSCRTDIESHIMGGSTDEPFLILVELRSSEVKYLETIGMIVGLVEEHLGPLDLMRGESRENRGGSSITKFQRLRIFLHFSKLYELHREIQLRIENAIRTQNVGAVLEIFEHGSEALDRRGISPAECTPLVDRIIVGYKSYLAEVESLRKYVLTLELENSNFARFLRSIEDRPESGRQKFVDLMMHPMQRWPRIMLLLKRLTESSEDSPFGEVAERVDSSRKAYQHAQKIVEKLNEGHEAEGPQNALMRTLEILSHIGEMPPLPWSENHALISRSELILKCCLNNEGISNVAASCFLFTHGLEMVRIKKSHTEKAESQPLQHIDFVSYADVNMLLVGTSLDSSHVEICYSQDDFSQEQVLLECNSQDSRDAFVSELRQLCPTSVEIHEINDTEQKLRCESLLFQWFQTRRDTVTKTLIRNFIGNVNKLF